MTTVKERRIEIARDVLAKQMKAYNLVTGHEHRPKIYAEVLATHVVEALFPDKLLDDVELP